MTYHIYKLNHVHAQIDNYLKQIVSLYYNIEEDAKVIIGTKNESLDVEILSQYYKRIETNATLMRYYVRKYPQQYEGKERYEQVIDSIAHSPEEHNDYDKLSDEFKKFCKNLEDSKEIETLIDRIMRFII